MAEMKKKNTSNMRFGNVRIVLKMDGTSKKISEDSSAGFVLKRVSYWKQIQCSFQDLPSCSQIRHNYNFFLTKEEAVKRLRER